VELDLCLIPKK